MKRTIFTIFLSTGISWGAQAMDQEGVRRLQPAMPGPADDVVSTTSSSQAGPDTTEEALPSVTGLSIDDEQVSEEERARLKKAAQNKKKREKQKLKARQKKAENSGDAQAASSDVPSAPSSNPGPAEPVSQIHSKLGEREFERFNTLKAIVGNSLKPENVPHACDQRRILKTLMLQQMIKYLETKDLEPDQLRCSLSTFEEFVLDTMTRQRAAEIIAMIARGEDPSSPKIVCKKGSQG